MKLVRKGGYIKMKTFTFRDVATGRIAKIKASEPKFAIRAYARRRKGKYAPNWEFLK